MSDLNRRDLLKASGLAAVGSAGVALAAQRSGASRRVHASRLTSTSLHLLVSGKWE